MIEQYIAFGAGIVIAIVCLLIGFMMGKTAILGNDNIPRTPRSFDPGPTTEPDGDYFGDEVMDYDNMSKRVNTI